MFDRSVFDRLSFASGVCLSGLFKGVGRTTGLVYPLTHFLFLNTPVLRGIMRRYGVSARACRAIPQRAVNAVAKIGLAPGRHIKEYHNFYDTLHLLLALAYADNFRVDFIPLATDEGVMHIGNTSVGSLRTKDLPDLYAQWCLLEFVAHPVLKRRYGRRLAPFRSAAEIRRRLAPGREADRMIRLLDRLLARLQSYHNLERARLPQATLAAHPPASSAPPGTPAGCHRESP